jgi:hypothetical protein
MSELNGFFSLRTPRDLLGKLESDFHRLRATDPASVQAQYAAFDFFVTALHLADWLSHATGAPLASCRAYAEEKLVSHVANGAKHFHVDVKRHTTVKDTAPEPGGFQADAFQGSAFQAACLVIELEDGTTVEVLDVATRVLNHWRTTVP